MSRISWIKPSFLEGPSPMAVISGHKCPECSSGIILSCGFAEGDGWLCELAASEIYATLLWLVTCFVLRTGSSEGLEAVTR